ncbi:hypothetical protein [Microbacterium karelineae]|nr:hypothetical protein [Microbacterium karelineae]
MEAGAPSRERLNAAIFQRITLGADPDEIDITLNDDFAALAQEEPPETS